MTCRFPGCDQPAEFCDLEHTVAYPCSGSPARAAAHRITSERALNDAHFAKRNMPPPFRSFVLTNPTPLPEM
ncbi:hypothetical protein A4G28_02010 [Mycobacterium ostraviense]|uniref:Uncharacterized protein n=1 Tax=Mycobacterium ostraviense TaxID=2738409 RepID=A0A163UF93_9MYCO|nr:hypothetical protein A4G28_02010 [Mycobacterium ostraviense]